MTVSALIHALAGVFDGPTPIERAAREACLAAAPAVAGGAPAPLPQAFLDVMAAPDAHPISALIAATPLPWAPPETSADPAYRAVSRHKMHVELVGPDGLAASDTVRLGLYGLPPGAEYGLRTHPAEEVFVMLAGEADWMRGSAAYAPHRSGARSHHPSMMPHATRTAGTAFLSAYAWTGDISTERYCYTGPPAS